MSSSAIRPTYGYPTMDGRHTRLKHNLIWTIGEFFRDDPDVYFSGYLIMRCIPGNRRQFVKPDVFLVRGVPKGLRENYRTWPEGKGPDVVIELTSSRTRHTDTVRKFAIYRDTLQVKEYFIFDPLRQYLVPPLQGYRLRKGQYVPIQPLAGRFPSVALGLHLEEVGDELRVWDPATASRLLTWYEQAAVAVEDVRREEEKARRAKDKARRAKDKADRTVAERDRLRGEIEMLRRQIRQSESSSLIQCPKLA